MNDENIEQVTVRVLPDGRMTRKDAAKYLGFDKNTLSNLAYRGKGPRWVKVGGKVFYFKDTLDRFIQGRIT